jgi:hypothetical protein
MIYTRFISALLLLVCGCSHAQEADDGNGGGGGIRGTARFLEEPPVEQACPSYGVGGRRQLTAGGAVITNGVLKLGVNEKGQLNGKFNVTRPLSVVHFPSLTFD